MSLMSRSSRFLQLLVALQALTLAACDSPSVPADASADSGPPPNCDALLPFATGDADGHAEPLGAPAGEARAGRLDASALPVDRTGLATWEAGDFVLANDRVALIVEDAGDSDLYDPFGGRPVGIARVEGGALVDAADYNEVILGFGGFLVESESVTVINDGGDGEAAVVRAVGPLGPLEFAGELLTTLVPGDYGGLPAALDYTLEPGSDAIDVHLEVQVPTPGAVRTRMLTTAFFQRYRMPRWLEGTGFADPPAGPQSMALFIDDAAASYAWIAGEERALTEILDVSGVLAYSQGRAVAEGCASTRFHVGTIVVGGPGLPGLQSALARRRGESLRTITGTVMESDGTTPATGVRVHVRRADGSHFARLTPAADGTFAVDVPDESVSFFAFREGMALVGPVDVAASVSTVALTMNEYRTIIVNVTDGDDPATDDFIPARVQIVPSAAPPAIPADLGELVHRNGRAHVAFTTTGSIELRVDPGLYEIIVSRGYEWEIVREGVDVTSEPLATLDAELQRVVDTTGVMCADYHIHTHRSPDSPDSPELKLMGLIADGLEIAIRSDHEWVNDFQPVIEAMGLEEHAFGIGGEELTTFAWGHFNIFPLTADPSRVNNGAVPWVGRLPPEVFDEARARSEAPAFIINHPRGAAIGGYFAAAGYNPVTNTAARQELWDDEFTLVEVFNDGDFEDFRESVVADWFGLLNGGRRVFAVGSSDSHGIWSSPVGYPRTCLELGTDDPQALTPNMVRDATQAGHSTISGGLYLTVVGPGGAGPGDDVDGAGATAMFDVTVRGACWIRATELEVIVDGVTTETIDIPVVAPAACDPLRLSATISVPVAAEGSWVVFHAKGDMDLSPVHPGRNPFAVSNPVFLTR